MTANTRRALTTSTTTWPARHKDQDGATQDRHGTSAREGAGREAQGRTAQAGAAGRRAIPDWRWKQGAVRPQEVIHSGRNILYTLSLNNITQDI